MRVTRTITLAALSGLGAAGGLYLGLISGAVTLDLGIGRRTRPLGPLEIEIAAPRQLVYDAAAAPYAVRQTRAMREKVEILERGDGMVLAAHRTPLGHRLTAVTTETVTFDPPRRIGFRLLRGPVPYVSETFEPHRDGERRHRAALHRRARDRPVGPRRTVGRPGRAHMGEDRAAVSGPDQGRGRAPPPMSRRGRTSTPQDRVAFCKRRHRPACHIWEDSQSSTINDWSAP